MTQDNENKAIEMIKEGYSYEEIRSATGLTRKDFIALKAIIGRQ